MSPGSWSLLAVLLLLAAGYVAFLYRRLEVPVDGWKLLAALRFAALATLLLLLLDPHLPVTGAGGVARTWIVVDRSLSMSVEGPAGSPWEVALDRARAAGAPVLFFGSLVRPAADLDDVGEPTDLRSLLAPALERAAESGARQVHVLGDLRVEDPAAARAVAARTGLGVVTEEVGGGAPGAALAAFLLPRAVDAGAPVPAEVAVAGTGGGPDSVPGGGPDSVTDGGPDSVPGGGPDSVTVEVREEERLVASRRIVAPGPGRVVRLELELPAPSAGRPGGESGVRYTARVRMEGDRFAPDDVRVAYTDVDPEEGNLVLVSASADWEPRFLLPVLGRVTGLPVRGYLQVGAGRYLVMDGAGAGGTVSAGDVERQARGAEILVAHGLGEGAAPWLLDVVDGARRAVVFASGAGGAAAAGLAGGPARSGEWYVSPDLPPSPLAAELAGVDLRGLPPLSGLVGLSGDEGPRVALTAQRSGSGPAQPVLALSRGPDGRRRAVVLADGLWRWAFRTDVSRLAYRRLWAGVAGWLLADPSPGAASGVRPLSRVMGRGEPLELSAPGAAGQALRLRLERGDSTVVDTTLSVSDAGTVRLEGPAPGAYRYAATVEGGEGPPVEQGGRFDVEDFSPELLHPRVTDLDVEPAPTGGADAFGPDRRPLRTHPLPYLVLLGLLCAEWIGRRRRGLR